MGNIGKNPHRPEGKADSDNQRMQAAWESDDAPFQGGVSGKEEYRRNLDQLNERAGGATELAAEDAEHAEGQVGGSRPGTRSRVKEAIEHREMRENEDRNE